MGIEVGELLAGTAGKGMTGGKRFVGGSSGQTRTEHERDLVKKFDLGAGSWGDDIVANLSQPTSVNLPDDESDSGLRLVERLRKEMNQAAARLDFEKAAKLRDRIFQLENSNSN